MVFRLINFVPPTQPYELSALVSDLVRFAQYSLRPAGRLVFFLPTVTDEYEEVDVQALLCPGMEIVANSVQDFGSWGRRVSKRTDLNIQRPNILVVWLFNW